MKTEQIIMLVIAFLLGYHFNGTKVEGFSFSPSAAWDAVYGIVTDDGIIPLP